MSGDKPEIGFVGLGVMGAGMALTLLREGFTVRGYDVSLDKVDALEKHGLIPARSLSQVATPLVFLSLPRAINVEEVLFGNDGLSDKLKSGSIVVDTSTISVSASRSLATRLAAIGIHFVDAPVSGGKKGAAEGKLSCMVGGSAETFAAVEPILSVIAGAALVHIGPTGAGLLCKACNQIVQAGTMLGVAEAIALCRKAEVDPDRVRGAMLGGAARSHMLENHAKRLIDRAFEPGFRSELMLKDLGVVLETCRDHGVFAPIVALAEQLFGSHCARNRGSFDWSSIGLLFQEMSNCDAYPRNAQVHLSSRDGGE